MTIQIELKVIVTLEHVTGKFASRDDMIEKLIEELEGAELSSLDDLGEDGATSYEVASWEIEEIERPAPVRRRRGQGSRSQ
jgi:Arc/MetJ-type ribon-helix-helix transcriptional regulator